MKTTIGKIHYYRPDALPAKYSFLFCSGRSMTAYYARSCVLDKVTCRVCRSKLVRQAFALVAHDATGPRRQGGTR